MIRFYRFPHSTNCERLSLALGHKGLDFESVEIDPADRSPVRKISGQDLVPVIDDGGKVVNDSMTIVRYLEDRYPEKPLYPADPARRAEVLVFIDWFNRVWKVPPNAMEAEMGRETPDRKKIAAWSAEMKGHLDLFESMLQGRDHLMGDEFTAADVCAWPFLRYSVLPMVATDEYLFHKILVEHQPLGEDHPRLKAWIHRVNEYPQP
ncbi:MAG TPA: glutathione S-transferase family protein [Candidatus Saccharimonadales bacterium]|nr:glutathione S-transferase family protein [Candidatus Saccharimonadales bacterium]